MATEFTKEELELVESFRKLNAAGRAAASEKLSDYVEMRKYTATEEELRRSEEQLQAKIAEIQKVAAGSIPEKTGFEFTWLDFRALDAISGGRYELINAALQYGFFNGYAHAKAGSAATL